MKNFTKILKNIIIKCKENNMSRKKSKKLQLITPAEEKLLNDLASEEAKTEESAISKREQMANMLFNNFLKNGMKVFNYLDNDYMTIVPYVDKEGEEKDDGTDIVCYEIMPKCNSEVVIYLDDKDIYASLKGKGIKLDDDELVSLAANIIGYVKKYCSIAA